MGKTYESLNEFPAVCATIENTYVKTRFNTLFDVLGNAIKVLPHDPVY